MNDSKLYRQFQDLHLSFPKLNLQKSGGGLWFVQGPLGFCAEYSGYSIEDEYKVEIIILDQYPDILPKIFETGHRIPITFHHLLDHSLCLGAPIAIKQKFKKEPTLKGFVCDCVIPYLYSFSYKSRFGKMPFGELSHGGIGILEYYQDLLGLKDNLRVLKFIKLLGDDNYRAEENCICESGKQNQDCHGKVLLEIKSLQSPAEFQAEYYSIIKNLMVIVEQQTRYLTILSR